MSNTVQAAAEGLPTDTQIAEAMKEMETIVRELSHMAHIVTNELERMFSPRPNISGSVKLERDEINRVMFAAYNVHSRCKDLEAKYDAAWNGEVLA